MCVLASRLLGAVRCLQSPAAQRRRRVPGRTSYIRAADYPGLDWPCMAGIVKPGDNPAAIFRSCQRTLVTRRRERVWCIQQGRNDGGRDGVARQRAKARVQD